MPNRALVIVLGTLGIVLVISAVAILLYYDGDKLIAIGGLATVAGLVIPGLLSLKQSADNANAIAKNTQITAETHTAVNSRMDQLLATVKALAEKQGALDSAEARSAGINEGREQALQPAEYRDDGTVVVTAPVDIVVKAPTNASQP